MGLQEKIIEWLFVNWKSTVAGLVLGAAGILKGYGIVIDDGTAAWVINHIVPVGVILLGFFAKDGKVGQ